MKIKAHTPLLALLFVSGFLHAQTTIPAGDTPVTVEGNVVVEGTTLLNGTLTVQPGSVVTPLSPNNNNANAIPPMTGDVGPTTTVVRTKLGEAAGSFDDVTGGGAVIETNGDTTLNSSTGNNVAVSFSRITEFQANNPDQANPGQPVPGTQVYYVATETSPGVFTQIPGTPTFTSEADLNTFITTTPVTDPLFAPAATSTPLPSTGGNLTVGGDATVTGQTTTNGISNSGEKITDVADGTADSDAATVGQVNAGDNAVRTEFAAADNVVRSEFAAADNVVRSEFAAADNVVRSEFAAADNVVRAEFAAADNVVRSEFAAADNVVRSEFAAADSLLSGRINDEVAARIQGDNNLNTRINTERDNSIARDNALGVRIDGVQLDLANETNNRIAADNVLRDGIDENTRGIAMVAAMTNTRVEAGKTHGIDFNFAQYQSETGFAFGYANRINDCVQVHGSLASTTDFEESVVRVGVAVQW